MGLQYVYFTAEDDEAAAAFAPETWPPPTYPNEDIRLDQLDDLEDLFTGRSVQEIRADPRYNADIVTDFNEEAGVVEGGIMAVTDTFTHALAVRDLSTLPAPYAVYVDALRELAVIARHAVARGHHMYCFWMV
jgi:hypothetical protein